jgi:hypothetical protein
MEGRMNGLLVFGLITMIISIGGILNAFSAEAASGFSLGSKIGPIGVQGEWGLILSAILFFIGGAAFFSGLFFKGRPDWEPNDSEF